MKKYFFLFLSLSMAHNIFSELPEMIIGKEAIAPGINLIFEGAIKDDVSPAEKFGYEKIISYINNKQKLHTCQKKNRIQILP